MRKRKERFQVRFKDINGISHFFIPPGEHHYSCTEDLYESDYIMGLLRNNPEIDKNMIYLIAKEIAKSPKASNIDWECTFYFVEEHFFKKSLEEKEYLRAISKIYTELVDLKLHAYNISIG